MMKALNCISTLQRATIIITNSFPPGHLFTHCLHWGSDFFLTFKLFNRVINESNCERRNVGDLPVEVGVAEGELGDEEEDEEPRPSCLDFDRWRNQMSRHLDTQNNTMIQAVRYMFIINISLFHFSDMNMLMYDSYTLEIK